MGTKIGKNAIIYLLLFTLWFRLFTLIDISVYNIKILILINIIIYFSRITFISKLPLYRFHYWLPKAHVESITIRSCILARIILKLGVYLIGINIQFIYIIRMLCSIIRIYIIIISLDFKIWVAFSTIVHITLMITRFHIINIIIIIYYIAIHSIISPILFNYIGNIYINSRTRIIKYLNIDINIIILLFIWVRIPLFINFYLELILFNYLYNFILFLLFFIIYLLSMITIFHYMRLINSSKLNEFKFIIIVFIFVWVILLLLFE